MSLLEMTQDILSDMDSDEVNSINDSVESLQVLGILKNTYEEILTEHEWPHLRTLMQLEASGDNTKPTHMKMPENTQYLEEVRYNKRSSTDTKDKYEGVTYKTPTEFLDILNSRDSSDSDTTVVTDFSSVSLFVLNDTAPIYWTSFDDEYLVFDSHDSSVDTTLQTSKTQCVGYREAAWSSVDDFVPDLPSKVFPYFLAEAKSSCFEKLKQMPSGKEEQKASRGKRRMSRDRFRQNGGITYPNYGRK